MEAHDILEQARREMQQRREAQLRQEQPWLWAFLGVAATLIIGVWFLPGNTLADRLHLVVQGVCAQAHYLYIGSFQMPLCARNTGIYAGFLGTLLFLVALKRGKAGSVPPLPITLLLASGVVAMGIDGVNSLLLDMGQPNLYTPRNDLRLLTGLLMGNSMAVFLLLMFNISLRGDVRAKQPIIASWPEYVGALLANALLGALIVWSPPVLFYPLAIFSVVGIVGVLFTTNVFVIGMVSGFEGRLRRLKELARPATIALLLTVGELTLLAWLRSVVEHSMPMG